MSERATTEPLLERADELAALAGDLDTVASTGRGRLVFVGGEAGIGKSTLIGEFCAGLDAPALRGASEALFTPRPLGPLIDIAAQVGGELERLVESESSPSAIVGALMRLLAQEQPTVVVLEDLHWADDATLDVVRLLARRCDAINALVIATYRDDELDRRHPLRIVLGELPRASVRRMTVAPLSTDAVAVLAEPYGVDAAALHERTGGNPFFVSEALAAGAGDMPDTVRDAVLARAARLDDRARRLLEAVAIVPQKAELWLLEQLAGDDLAHLESCLASGMLQALADAVAFRHEIARVAIEGVVAPDRALALHRRALRALISTPGRKLELARGAHHAEAAGDPEAVLRYAPAAGEQAAAVGAHREAAAQFARALRFAGGLDSGRRAELLERRSYECYLTNAMDDAIVARETAMAERRDLGDRLGEGDAHRWLSRLRWFMGDNAAAEAEANMAVELLEPLPPGRELAMAYSNIAQLRMLAHDAPQAGAWGARAIDLAQRLGEAEILVHALNNLGTAELQANNPEGAEKMDRSLELALAAGLEEHVARAHTNRGCFALERRDYDLAARHLGAGIAYCRDRDLDPWFLYMTGWVARLEMEQGRWDDAAESALTVLKRDDANAPSRITPLAVLGRLRARRGDPGQWTPLDEAYELASATGELQRLLPVAFARAEARWLAGEPQSIESETSTTLELAIVHGSEWEVGELLIWRRRAGLDDTDCGVAPAEPFARELAGDAEGASRLWAQLGCRYEAALALLGSRDEDAVRRALDELGRLGARRTAAHASRELRRRGVRDLRRGPHAATMDNPSGLTARELDVLRLLAAGMRNAQIAQQLVVSPRTVGHHVSAILAKLSVTSRTEAAAEAARLGIIER
ncbi:MAG TPA: LuxR C-terminal-related transcriptional regulator [Solirubrobacteraceae bacterium]|jgi:DNA-binding CsgD family transcriptional regulator/tetratricopeptide (TPR) repeat protein